MFETKSPSLVFVILISLLLRLAKLQETDEKSAIKVRLSDGDKISEGRVEILHNGEWGTICDDDWNLEAANVICHMLGYEGAFEYVHSGKFGPGEGPIWLDNVHCSGNEENILNCELKEFGDNDCQHHEDAGVRCNGRRLPNFMEKIWRNIDSTLDEIRLQPPKGNKKRIPQLDGYVETFHEGKWRKICDKGWSDANSRIACGQLGFPDATDLRNKDEYLAKAKKKHHYWLNNVECKGSESKLAECKYEKTNITIYNNCPTQPVVIRCVPGERYSYRGFKKMKNQKRQNHHFRSLMTPTIRLIAGALEGEGRLQVKRDGRWGSVCHHRFDMEDANVACRQLGLGTAKRFLPNSQFGVGHGPIWMNNLDCNGDELRLDDCPHDEIFVGYEGYNTETDGECSHYEEVGVACHVPDTGLIKKVRLVGGRNPMEGLVEVQIGRRWGAVCSDDWTAKEAAIVCRQLGFGFALRALQDAWFYESSNDSVGVIMSGVHCTGDEIALQFCQHNGKKIGKCGDSRRTMVPFAGVICTDSAPDLIMDVPLLQQSIHLEIRELSRLQCAAEENCLSASAALMDWPFGNRKLLRFSSQIWNRGRADFRPSRTPDQWLWHACHGHFHSMGEFTHYDILDLNHTKVAEGHKASFCLEDSECDPDVPKRYDCDQPGGGTQGIAVGCSDTYAYNIDCQWIDISDLNEGNYVVRIHVNPNHLVPESNFANNEVMCNMQYRVQQVWVFNCHIRDDYDLATLKSYYSNAIYP